jgi:hypothetical protein
MAALAEKQVSIIRQDVELRSLGVSATPNRRWTVAVSIHLEDRVMIAGQYASNGIRWPAMTADEKPLFWIGSARKDPRAMPKAVPREFGFARRRLAEGA